MDTTRFLEARWLTRVWHGRQAGADCRAVRSAASLPGDGSAAVAQWAANINDPVWTCAGNARYGQQLTKEASVRICSASDVTTQLRSLSSS